MPTPREMMEAAKRREQEERAQQRASRQESLQEPRQAQPVQAQGRVRVEDPRRQRANASTETGANAGKQRGSTEAPQERQPRGRTNTRTRESEPRRQARKHARDNRPQRQQAQTRAQHAGRPAASTPSFADDTLAREQAKRQKSRYLRGYITRWRMFGIIAFSTVMVLGGIIGLLFFARPTTSAVEMRNLTAYPEFTVESFLDGSYFTQVSLWYADTYPLREPMVAADHAIDSLFGVNTGTGMVGGNVQADEIPVQEEAEPVKPVTVTPPAAAPDEHAVAEDIQENIMSGVYIQDGAGYAIYYFSQNAADTYIAAMNTAAKELDGVSTVYSIMAPANSITLTDEQAASVGGSDQQQTLDYLRTRFDDRVKSVEIVDTIKQHRDEYLYFRTDHHWTQLGAYYAYVEFCNVKGIEPKSLSSWKEAKLGEFQGTYYDTIEAMGNVTPDEITAYVPSGTNDLTYWSAYGEEVDGKVINEDAASWEPSYKYTAFIAGDQTLEIIHNPAVTDGSSCLVVKDSYGCAFVPNLVDNYETIHVIDFRETDENLVEYAKSNNIQDVIFMTGMKIGLTDSVAQTLLTEVSPTTAQNVVGGVISDIRSRAHGALE